MLLSLLPSRFMRISPNTQPKEYKNYCPSDKSYSIHNQWSMWHVTFCKAVLIGLICSYRVGQRSFSIVKDTPVDHSLLKLFKSNVNWKTNGCHYWAKLLLKTTAVRNRPSRLMLWWSRFTTISITLTWEVIRHIFLYKFLAWDCVSLPNESETPFFSNSPKEKKSQADRSGDRAAPSPPYHSP
jgi:hypothetical protein